MIHQRTHPAFVEGCFACRIATVSIAAAAMPYRREQTHTMITSWDKQMKDDDAFRRLVKNGLHPPRTAGCAELELVDDKRFIEATPYWEGNSDYELADTSDTPQVKVES